VLDNEGGQDLVKLIQLIAEGDESAFAPLYDATSGLLFDCYYSSSISSTDVQRMVQGKLRLAKTSLFLL
jgi:hypothetical protein